MNPREWAILYGLAFIALAVAIVATILHLHMPGVTP